MDLKLIGDDSIKIISPAQSTVDKARSEVEQENDINIGEVTALTQSGGGASRSKSKKGSRKTTKTKKKTIKKPAKNTKKSSKKKTKKSTTKRPIWM